MHRSPEPKRRDRPLNTRDHMIRQYLLDGVPIDRIAKLLDISRQRMYQIRAKIERKGLSTRPLAQSEEVEKRWLEAESFTMKLRLAAEKRAEQAKKEGTPTAATSYFNDPRFIGAA